MFYTNYTLLLKRKSIFIFSFIVCKSMLSMQGPFYLDKIARYSINSHQHVLSPEKIKKLFIPENPDFSNARVITDIDSLYAVLKDTYSA